MKMKTPARASSTTVQPAADARERDLRRVRAIALAAMALEGLKVLPLVDGIVLLVEWIGLKTTVPVLLAWRDLAREGSLTVRTASRAVVTDTWPALLARALPMGAAVTAVALDAGSDAAAGVLPAPFDAFDVPPLLVDGAIAAAAHHALVRAVDQAPAGVGAAR